MGARLEDVDLGMFRILLGLAFSGGLRAPTPTFLIDVVLEYDHPMFIVFV